MTENIRAREAARMYVTYVKELKTIDKEKDPYTYEKTLQLVWICAMMLKRYNVKITL
jgi:hypothetical protein